MTREELLAQADTEAHPPCTGASVTHAAAPPSAAQPVECLCCGTTASGVAIQHAECASAVICGSCVEVMRTAPDLAARVARLEGLLSRAQPSHSHSIKCRDSNSDENCLRCAINAALAEGQE